MAQQPLITTDTFDTIMSTMVPPETGPHSLPIQERSGLVVSPARPTRGEASPVTTQRPAILTCPPTDPVRRDLHVSILVNNLKNHADDLFESLYPYHTDFEREDLISTEQLWLTAKNRVACGDRRF